MKILGIESSSMTASVALVSDDIVMAEFTINNKRTHSETLLPMIDKMLDTVGVNPEELDAVAISAGPGSFTGLRIGAATAKGLALALDIPLVAVPTLEGLAYNLAGDRRLVASVMDARREEVYAGLYDVKDGIKAVIEEDALPAEEFIKKLEDISDDIVFVGDGIGVIKNTISKMGDASSFDFAAIHNDKQRGASIASLGKMYMEMGKSINPDDFAPEYLRKSQAERVRDENK